MRKILIVDDEPNIVMSLEYTFKKNNFEVFIARDGQEALDILQNQLPDVTLSTSTNGAHTHTAGTSSTYLLNLTGSVGYQILNSTTNTSSTSSSGSHSHTTSSINGGVTQQALNVQNPYMAINGFVYLGK